MTVFAVAMALAATGPAAAQDGWDTVRCSSSATSGTSVGVGVGISGADSVLGDQDAVQIGVNNMVQAGNVAVNVGSGSAIANMIGDQDNVQTIDQDICSNNGNG